MFQKITFFFSDSSDSSSSSSSDDSSSSSESDDEETQSEGEAVNDKIDAIDKRRIDRGACGDSGRFQRSSDHPDTKGIRAQK